MTTLLRSQFGVTGVWVFGSLVEGDHFTERHCPEELHRAVERSGVEL